ncbi:uncharacterized protein LOC101743858 isoform X4 [Bombyx mori]|uniref:Cyclic nucleotide-binding domain-containing protein n=1 Tax=Bombyx mori TaxID=7091 RepID=A0A8R2DNB5_BOMMO|nr:uncharacterized protein LOC101743858 isoform X3 [Bombyx mori]
MPKTEGLHELYYEHICSITSKTDVLESDITGNGFVINLKRKWCDLFLLSYEDKRTRNYYTSSHAIRLERLRQFRHCIYRIHPFSKFRNFWDFLIVNVFLCNKILQHHNTSVILVTNTIIPYYIGIFFEFIIILDLFVNMNTGYVDSESREIILDLKKGLREIMLSCYRGYIMRIPYFCDWPVSVIEDIVVMLKEKIYLANDIVAEPWIQGDGLIIVDAGELAVYSVDDEETAHLIDGDYFGELSLITDKEVRTSYVVTITDSQLISLVVAVVVASPTPGGGGGHKHVTIHVPYKIHTIHHHHVSKVHVPVHVPVIKEVQVIKEVPIIKHVPVPIVKHVPFPVVKHVEVEKKVIVPVHHHEHHEHHEEEQHGWEGEALHGWN